MKRFALLLSALLLGILSVACSSGDKTTVVNNPPATKGISVSGHGEVQAPPDTGFFQAGVQVRAKAVADARDGAAKATDAVIKSLNANGIADADIKTSSYTISPEYDYSKAGQPTLTGYVVSATLEVKVRKLDTFGKVVDGAATAAGDAVRIQGVSFGIDDNAKLLEQARKAAMDDARKKAEQLAQLGGAKLGKPVTITESQSSRPAPVPVASAAGKGATDIAVQPLPTGNNSVTVDLAVIWDISD